MKSALFNKLLREEETIMNAEDEFMSNELAQELLTAFQANPELALSTDQNNIEEFRKALGSVASSDSYIASMVNGDLDKLSDAIDVAIQYTQFIGTRVAQYRKQFLRPDGKLYIPGYNC